MKEIKMYNEPEYKEKLNLQSICEYLRYGELPSKLKAGTLEERERRIYKAIPQSLVLFRDRVIKNDWSTVGSDPDSRMNVTEDFWHEVMDAIADLSSFEYEMGFRAALAISFDIFEKNKFKENIINEAD